jgi:two-component system, chemotaxis family, chemotaxis protein CheY
MTSESCPATILVVEDNEDIREAIAEILEQEGYRVAVAEDGVHALELLTEVARPCLLLVDLVMPKMDGWLLLQALSKNDRLATIPVVVLSAASSASQLEGRIVVKKPVDMAILLQIVREHCCGERGPDPASRGDDLTE